MDNTEGHLRQEICMSMCYGEPAIDNPGSLGRRDHKGYSQSKAGSGGGRAGLRSQAPSSQAKGEPHRFVLRSLICKLMQCPWCMLRSSNSEHNLLRSQALPLQALLTAKGHFSRPGCQGGLGSGCLSPEAQRGQVFKQALCFCF